ncbi:MAG: hypothetical protein IPP01_15175 [Saprospiraceae bacterium]|nr:hypothetical protein [Saprospiraceae bacterium]
MLQCLLLRKHLLLNCNNEPETKLIEGIDYTIENGLFVFTSLYLTKRGYCCGNGCRNCPYGKELRIE